MYLVHFFTQKCSREVGVVHFEMNSLLFNKRSLPSSSSSSSSFLSVLNLLTIRLSRSLAALFPSDLRIPRGGKFSSPALSASSALHCTGLPSGALSCILFCSVGQWRPVFFSSFTVPCPTLGHTLAMSAALRRKPFVARSCKWNAGIFHERHHRSPRCKSVFRQG